MDCVRIAEEDEMAFSLENQQWIKDEINRAIRAAVNPPGRAARILRGLRDYGLTAAIYAVPIGLLAIIVALGLGLVNRRETEATFRGTTQERLGGIERQLIDLRALVASSQPTREQNQNAARRF